MDNLSAQQKLMGNMQATSAELLSGIMEERGRGFASDREAWAQLKENIENVESRMKAIKDVHKDMWSAVKGHNGDAFCALAGEFQRSAILLAVELMDACGKRVCSSEEHWGCPYGNEGMADCAVLLEAAYEDTIEKLLELKETLEG